MTGAAHAIVAGGTESMSMVPMGGNKIAPNPALVDSYPGRLPDHRSRRREPRARLRHLARGAGRLRASAATSAPSPRSTPAASRDETVALPLAGGQTFAVDEGPRRETSIEALAKLRPAFHATGSVTAGNSSQMSDGASAVVVMSGERMRELRIEPLARFVGYATAGVEPEKFGIGPVPAVRTAPEADRPHPRPDRPGGTERSVRRAGAGLPARAADRSRPPERQRRRGRARASARLHRPEIDGRRFFTRCSGGARATDWSRCASAAAWARRGYLKGVNSPLHTPAINPRRNAQSHGIWNLEIWKFGDLGIRSWELGVGLGLGSWELAGIRREEVGS